MDQQERGALIERYKRVKRMAEQAKDPTEAGNARRALEEGVTRYQLTEAELSEPICSQRETDVPDGLYVTATGYVLVRGGKIYRVAHSMNLQVRVQVVGGWNTTSTSTSTTGSW
jgi:hypothetical protein